jgi:hypothetical protein
MHTTYKNLEMVKRPNLRIHRVQKGAEIQTKGIGNLFNEIIAENFPNVCNNIDSHRDILNSK